MQEVKKPTPTQLDVLRNALSTRGDYAREGKPSGRLRRLPMVSTLAILKANGWIAQDRYIRDEAERAALKTRQDDHINAAKIGLENGLWQMSLNDLKSAAAIEATLNRMDYWITPAGAALVPTQGIHHVDGNVYNNSRDNLRVVDVKENLRS